MRVLLIDVNCKKGSTGKIVYDLYQQLKADGHEAAICYGRGEPIVGENIFKFGLDWETNIHAGLARLTGLNGYFSPLSTKRLIRFIESFKPDVVHIHELHAYFVNHKPLLTYLQKKQIKVVWTFHCEYMYTGKCGHAYECEKWKTECGNCPAVRDYPKSLYLDFTRKMFRDKKRLLENMDFTIVTPSKWLADRVRMSFLKSKEIIVIHNGIETETVFYPREQADIDELKGRYGLDGKKIVLSVAPNIMDERKGGKTVLEVSNRFIGEPVHFVLVGAEQDKTIDDNVTLIKQTANQDELALWYSAADVFLICSKRETFSMTCAEALCCGTPVAGLKSGAPETVFKEPYAVFVESRDVFQLKSVLTNRLSHSINSCDVRNYGVNNFSKGQMFFSYLAVYREI